jgi:uncharacterized protein (DUF433 family)
MTTSASTKAGVSSLLPAAEEAWLDAMILVNTVELGRHNARLRDSKLPVAIVLQAMWGNEGDVERTMREWSVTEEEIRAALRYYQLHRALFDAYFLVKEEEDNAPIAR